MLQQICLIYTEGGFFLFSYIILIRSRNNNMTFTVISIILDENNNELIKFCYTFRKS